MPDRDRDLDDVQTDTDTDTDTAEAEVEAHSLEIGPDLHVAPPQIDGFGHIAC
jgi:hypothetical protein